MSPTAQPVDQNGGDSSGPLTQRFLEATRFAWELHGTQLRKKNRAPFLSHLFAVTALVLEYGGGETEAIAALLHDAVEDQGGMATAREIERRFGRQVHDIVMACSDCEGEPKPPWRQRKERLFEQLAAAGSSARLVAAADKLHNVRCVASEYEQHGEEVWESFHGRRDGTIWFYQTVARVLDDAESTPLTRRLLQETDDLVKSVS